MVKQIKKMKRNRPDLYRQFLFGIAMAVFNVITAIALLLCLCFYL